MPADTSRLILGMVSGSSPLERQTDSGPAGQLGTAAALPGPGRGAVRRVGPGAGRVRWQLLLYRPRRCGADRVSAHSTPGPNTLAWTAQGTCRPNDRSSHGPLVHRVPAEPRKLGATSHSFRQRRPPCHSTLIGVQMRIRDMRMGPQYTQEGRPATL